MINRRLAERNDSVEQNKHGTLVSSCVFWKALSKKTTHNKVLRICVTNSQDTSFLQFMRHVTPSAARPPPLHMENSRDRSGMNYKKQESLPFPSDRQKEATAIFWSFIWTCNNKVFIYIYVYICVHVYIYIHLYMKLSNLTMTIKITGWGRGYKS